jgi:hypothetical protein
MSADHTAFVQRQVLEHLERLWTQREFRAGPASNITTREIDPKFPNRQMMMSMIAHEVRVPFATEPIYLNI